MKYTQQQKKAKITQSISYMKERERKDEERRRRKTRKKRRRLNIRFIKDPRISLERRNGTEGSVPKESP